MNTSDSTVMLRAHLLTYAYPGRHVFDGFSAEFRSGLTWLKGANGSGKSTLLKLLAGATEPQAGTRTAMGIDAVQDPLAYRRSVFWCGPDALPFDHLLPMEYLGFMQGLYPSFMADAVPVHLQGLGLQHQMGVPLARMSTGTKRKMWLLAALVSGTPIVLLDEPFNALDADASAYLHSALAREAAPALRCWVVASHVAPVPHPPYVLDLGL